jgi:hypothetical protein
MHIMATWAANSVYNGKENLKENPSDLKIN